MCYDGKRIGYSRRRRRVGKFSSEAWKASLRKCPLSQKEEEELAREQMAQPLPVLQPACCSHFGFPFPSLDTVLGARNRWGSHNCFPAVGVEGRTDRSTDIDKRVWSGTIEEWQPGPLVTSCLSSNNFWLSLLTGFSVCEDRCGCVIGEGHWRGVVMEGSKEEQGWCLLPSLCPLMVGRLSRCYRSLIKMLLFNPWATFSFDGETL